MNSLNHLSETDIDDNVWDRTSFCTSSYISDLRGKRSNLVSRSIQTWKPLLQLPFHESVFLDDLSPSCNAIQLLRSTDMLHAFDEVHYQTAHHPPHSNFGIVASMNLCNGSYVLHIDDDVIVDQSVASCRQYISKMLSILEYDRDLHGISFLTQSSITHDEWTPHKPYSKDNLGLFAHPKKYFGTAACLIRKSMIDYIPFEQILDWGKEQPANWEQLVSVDPSMFLVNTTPTPFQVDDEAWTTRATDDNSISGRCRRIISELKRKLYR